MTAYGQAEMKLVEIRRYLIARYDYKQTNNTMYPLIWYIRTGRASRDFCLLLAQKKGFMIARQLVKGGSIEEVIERIKAYVGYKSSF